MSIADRFTKAFAHGVRDAIAADDLTDPAAVARWAQWQTPDQWLSEHSHKEDPMSTTRTPWFAAYEHPGRSGRVGTGAAMTREERNVLTINAKAAEIADRQAVTS